MSKNSIYYYYVESWSRHQEKITFSSNKKISPKKFKALVDSILDDTTQLRAYLYNSSSKFREHYNYDIAFTESFKDTINVVRDYYLSKYYISFKFFMKEAGFTVVQDTIGTVYKLSTDTCFERGEPNVV